MKSKTYILDISRMTMKISLLLPLLIVSASILTSAFGPVQEFIVIPGGGGSGGGNVTGSSASGYPYIPRWSLNGVADLEDTPLLATDDTFTADLEWSIFQNVLVSINLSSNADQSAMLGLPTQRWKDVQTMNLTGYSHLNNGSTGVTFSQIIAKVNEASPEIPLINISGNARGNLNMSSNKINFSSGFLEFRPTDTGVTYFGKSPKYGSYFGFETQFNETDAPGWVINFAGGFYAPSQTDRKWYLNYGATVPRDGVPIDVSVNEGSTGAFLQTWNGIKVMGTQGSITRSWMVNGSDPAAKDLTIKATSSGPGAGGNLYITPLASSNRVNITQGELWIGGISRDGTGKAVCIKSNGDLGTCTNAVGASGTCTCA